MTTSSEAIMKWQYWLFNHDDIEKTFMDIYPEWLAKHFLSKFNYFVEKYHNTAHALIELYMEMDSFRQQELSDWVSKCYHGIDETIDSIQSETRNICSKYESCDFYSVEKTDSGETRVHIDGFMYNNDESLQLVEFAFLYLTTSQIADALKKDGDLSVLLDLVESETKQYQGDITPEEFVHFAHDAKELPISEVTEDTPEGWYVSY